MTDLRLLKPGETTSGASACGLPPGRTSALQGGPTAHGVRRPVGAGLPLASLLPASGLTAASLLAASRADSQSSSPSNPTASWMSLELRLVRRLTNGLTASEAAFARQIGYAAYLERQLNDTAINDSAVENYVAVNFPMLAMTPLQLMGQSPILQLTEGSLYRALFSQRQLRQRMVEFWSDYFNVCAYKVDAIVHDREVIRPNALGKFPDLLRAVAHSPAMLYYLDNTTSRKECPNQNYARELMELHTLGSGNFTQQDVTEVARCFTGWTRGTDPKQSSFGKFVFDASAHDNNSKIVLGHVIAAGGGVTDGDQVLSILATHPGTAQHIAVKMLQWLLCENPSDALVGQIAQVYTRTGGDIKMLIRAILSPATLQGAPAKFKRPLHLAASGLRATSASVSKVDFVRGRLEGMGQTLFGWSPPNGYPDTQAYWAAAMLPRWNFGMDLLFGQIAHAYVDCGALMAAKTISDVVQMINTGIFAGEISGALASSLTAFLIQNPKDARVSAVALALASPDFQWY